MNDLDLEIKLTAYALGELTQHEREQIEVLLKEKPDLQSYVDEVTASSAMLEAELGKEEAPQLQPEMKKELERALRMPVASVQATRPKKRRRWAYRAIAAIAVSAAAIFTVSLFLQRSYEVHPAAMMAVEEIRLVPSSAQGAPSRTAQIRTTVQPTVPPYYEPREVMNSELPQRVVAEEPADPHEHNPGETYGEFEENGFTPVLEQPLSTFGIDVDTASYANVRRMITSGQWPPKNAVRIEEMLNYFTYRLPPPVDSDLIAVHVDVTDTPWNNQHLLARVALKGREIARNERSDANLVFLIDVSGSMDQPNRLPLVKQSLRLLIEELSARDSVAIVVYAGASGLVLPPTSGAKRGDIEAALDQLKAGGGTDGGGGIQLAYKVARSRFKKGGINRLIIATDGDFNVGVVNREALEVLIKEQAKSGVFLTVLGYGMGNLKDATLEMLANKGNGNYAYIDRIEEARKVLVDELFGTLITIAKDVKIQIEFNPARIGSYRLIGYENRALAARDFNDENKDAGEIGSGHSVTALYELVPAGKPQPNREVDPLRYQQDPDPQNVSGHASQEIFTVKVRYKHPDGDRSLLIERPVHGSQGHYADGSVDLRFAAAVAAYGMILRNSPHKGSATLEKARAWAASATDLDQGGLRSELVTLIDRTIQLQYRR